MAQTRGKRRSASQRIGDKAEFQFGAWATDRGLSPNLVSKDYGLDFICQILNRVPGVKTEEVHGALLAVQVRGTKSSLRPRIKLTKVDAENLLRQNNPACVVALNPDTGPVSFRFVDEEFSKVLEGFVASRRSSMTLYVSEMDSDAALFDQTLVELRRPGTQYRQRIERVRRDLARRIPGSEFAIRSDSRGPVNALVSVPWLGSIFEVSPEHADTVRGAVFETGKLPFDSRGVSLKSEILAAADLADGGMFIAGIAESESTVTVEAGATTASMAFSVRRLADERAYTHSVGLTFVVSDARQKGAHWVHELEVQLFKGEPLSILDPAFAFLCLLTPDASIDLGHGHRMPLKSWSDSVATIGPSMLGLQAVVSILGIELNEFRLSDLKDEEFARSVAFAYMCFCDKIPAEQLIPGFVLNLPSDISAADVPTRDAHIDMPVAFNLGQHGVIVWFEASGACFLDQDQNICGLQLKHQISVRAELHDRFEKSVYPEAWIDKFIPPFRLGEQWDAAREFKAEEHPGILYTARIGEAR